MDGRRHRLAKLSCQFLLWLIVGAGGIFDSDEEPFVGSVDLSEAAPVCGS